MSKDSTARRDQLVDSITQEMKRIKDKLVEIRGQIEQMQREVDRAQQKNDDINDELQVVQYNIETVPRQDIRAKYDAAMDARMRLTTMRSQLEKSNSDREQLERQQALLAQLMNQVQGVEALGSGIEASPSPGATKGPVNIVRIVQAQEEEKLRLARLMHDGPAQSLTNFILQTEICQRLFDRDPARAAEELGNLKTAASVTFQKVRDFIFDLRPMMLDDLGVVPTVRRFIDSFRERTDMEVKLDFVGEERRLESHREVMLFRGIQELLGHARDYAQATEVFIRLDMSTEIIKVEVEDNGRGFDAEATFSGDYAHVDPRTQGLITLKEKFELVRGTVSVTSGEGEGTHVSMSLPASDESV
ncbi:MAG: hypothetical protein JNM70_12415 [Anaerolineae bacterium]|nr:hypothetical protein [Anaerolineae bacterium]